MDQLVFPETPVRPLAQRYGSGTPEVVVSQLGLKFNNLAWKLAHGAGSESKQASKADLNTRGLT